MTSMRFATSSATAIPKRKAHAYARVLRRARRESKAVDRGHLRAHFTLLNPQYTPGSVTPLKDVSLQTLNGEVFVD